MSDLENRYSTLFGNETSKGRLQGGFFVLAFGVLLGLTALTLFFFAVANAGDKTTYYNLMKAGLTLGPIGLAAISFGGSLALPTKTSMRVFGYVGLGLTLVASLLFFLHYPTHFNVASKGSKLQDFMPLDVAVFAFGFVMMVAANISSIVGFYLGRTTVVQGEAGEEEDIYGAGYEIPDWVVERDIEYAMKKYGVSWGEGSLAKGDKTLHVNVADSMGTGFVVGGLGKARTVQLDAEHVDSAVKQLSGVRPNKKGAIPGEWADDATRALVAFRKQKEANPTAFRPKQGFWARVGGWFTGRSTRPAPKARAAPAPAGAAVVRANGASAPARKGKTIVIEDQK
ncbi:MAG TPA: hypothetical protein VM286_04955 [Candidatus Thermoplasmatota archaeon]|nr:hypothetical protein [Candidatus Thermoplasmatota archaeon]